MVYRFFFIFSQYIVEFNYFCKIINKKEFPASETPNFLANLKFLASMSHPNIIKILDVQNNKNYIIISIFDRYMRQIVDFLF